MNIFSTFSWTALTNPLPGGDFLMGFVWLLFFLGLFFVGRFIRQYAGEDKYLKKSLRKRLWPAPLFGGIGFFLVLCRFAEVSFFSMRLWLLIVVVGSLVWGGWTAWKVRRDYLKRLASVERERGKTM